LIARLLDALWDETAAADEQRSGGKVTHLGFSDLSGQLRAALDQFDGVNLTPFSWVAGLIVAYILLIGPVDYFLLRRFARRMELTWLTFSLMVIGLGAAAWLLANWARGESVQVNQVDVVDVDTKSLTIRGTSWLQIYSPSSERFDLSLAPAVPAEVFAPPVGRDSARGLPRPSRGLQPAEVLLSWQGLPGSGLAGMDAPSRSSVGDQSYTIANSQPASEPPWLSLKSLPIGDGMTRSLIARWRGDWRGQGESDLWFTSTKLLRGHLQNPLPLRLKECVLYFDRWAYELGTMEPGQRVSLDGAQHPLDVKLMLNERRYVDSRDVTVPWDQAMRDDVPRIVRVMMFHETAQGRSFTRLTHRYNGFIDLSSLLSERAILVGRAEEPAAVLTSHRKPLASAGDRRWTYYRVILPTRPE
jgi:hypothetical protein